MCRGLNGLYGDVGGLYGAVWVVGECMGFCSRRGLYGTGRGVVVCRGLYQVLWGCVGCWGHYGTVWGFMELCGL